MQEEGELSLQAGEESRSLISTSDDFFLSGNPCQTVSLPKLEDKQQLFDYLLPSQENPSSKISAEDQHILQVSQKQRSKTKKCRKRREKKDRPIKSYRVESKNVLANIKSPILQYCKRYEHGQSRALTILAKAKSVNLMMYEQLFKEKSVRTILASMFETRYLKRAYQLKRAEQSNKLMHMHRIRQIEKMFIITARQYPQLIDNSTNHQAQAKPQV